MHRDEARLLDIGTAARLVLEFKEGMDKAAFLDDSRIHSSILHHLTYNHGKAFGTWTPSQPPPGQALHQPVPPVTP